MYYIMVTVKASNSLSSFFAFKSFGKQFFSLLKASVSSFFVVKSFGKQFFDVKSFGISSFFAVK